MSVFQPGESGFPSSPVMKGIMQPVEQRREVNADLHPDNLYDVCVPQVDLQKETLINFLSLEVGP